MAKCTRCSTEILPGTQGRQPWRNKEHDEPVDCIAALLAENKDLWNTLEAATRSFHLVDQQLNEVRAANAALTRDLVYEHDEHINSIAMSSQLQIENAALMRERDSVRGEATYLEGERLLQLHAAQEAREQLQPAIARAEAAEQRAARLEAALTDCVAEIKYWLADYLEPEECEHPRGSGPARVVDAARVALSATPTEPAPKVQS